MPSSACDWSSDVCSSDRSEEHTSELQSRSDLVCRLLLEKKKKNIFIPYRLHHHIWTLIQTPVFLCGTQDFSHNRAYELAEPAPFHTISLTHTVTHTIYCN